MTTAMITPCLLTFIYGILYLLYLYHWFDCSRFAVSEHQMSKLHSKFMLFTTVKIPRLHVKIPKSQVDRQIPKILGKIPSSGSAVNDVVVRHVSTVSKTWCLTAFIRDPAFIQDLATIRGFMVFCYSFVVFNLAESVSLYILFWVI